MKQALFESGSDGWTIIGGTGGHDATGGVGGGGALTGQDNAAGDWAFAAPADWLGDLSGYYGAALSFQQRQKVLTSQSPDTAPDVILRGNGVVLVANVGAPPGTDWTGYSVTLSLGQGWKVGSLTGRTATEAEIRGVLANLTGLEIRGDYVSGLTDDIGWLDTVELSDPDPVLPGPAGWQVRETFDTGLGGWSFVADVAEFRWAPDGGNPGGHVTAVDFSTGEIWYFAAPGRFLGDKGGFHGGTLSFDLKQSSLRSQFDEPDVILTGAGMRLIYDTPDNPGLDWTGYAVSLTAAAGWRVGGLGGAAATEAQLRAVLADLTALHIRGEYVVGSDSGALDNVALTAAQARVYLLSDPVEQRLIRGFDRLQNALDQAGDGAMIAVQSASRIGTGPWMVEADALTLQSGKALFGSFVLGADVGVFTLTGAGRAAATATSDRGVRVDGSDGANRLTGAQGADSLTGGDGADTLQGLGGDDRLEGGKGKDLIGGDDGADQVRGRSGDDRLLGGARGDWLDGGHGNDTLSGETGQDTLRGGAGDDVLQGGKGNDRMTGGAGADRFVFGPGGGRDVVRDFDLSADRLVLDATLWGDSTTDLARILADFAVVAGTDTVFTFAGGETLTLKGFVHVPMLDTAIELF